MLVPIALAIWAQLCAWGMCQGTCPMIFHGETSGTGVIWVEHTLPGSGTGTVTNTGLTYSAITLENKHPARGKGKCHCQKQH